MAVSKIIDSSSRRKRAVMEKLRMISTMREEREGGNWAPWLVSSKWSIQRGTLKYLRCKWLSVIWAEFVASDGC